MKTYIHYLEGTVLDAMVLEALGLEVKSEGDSDGYVGYQDGNAIAIVGDPGISPYIRSPSREWAVGGPLIEANEIAVWVEKGEWYATCFGQWSTGPTPLVAAMRALCLAGLPPDK